MKTPFTHMPRTTLIALLLAVVIFGFATFVYLADAEVYHQLGEACTNGIQWACDKQQSTYWFLQFLPR